MLFNSLEFAIFFPIVAMVYFLLPQRLRTVHLLISSCIFYMAFIPAYILILATTILIDYVAGIYLERAAGRARTLLLWSSIAATCTVLFAFKYFHFFVDNFVGFAGILGWQLTGPSIQIILPIGLSFHTFQSLSYVIEVHQGRQKAERNFVTYATYVMFFPQLVAGPIERPQNLLHQFRELHEFDYERVVSGLKRMAWGFFKKLVIADRLALYVNDVYAAPQNFNGLQLTLATVFFAYQIYCDFSGYSDIAIGSARVLGFRLRENFDEPYHSLSISEFWHRWHISLSTWFRDYVYFPLGGNRLGTARHIRNLLFTFGVSGLWHGASWTYVLWGLMNGLYMVFGMLTKPARSATLNAVGLGEGTFARTVVKWATTFLLTCVAWVFFRAKTLSDAWYILTHFASGWNFGEIGTQQFLLRQLPVAMMAIALLELIQLDRVRNALMSTLITWSRASRWAVYATFTMGVVMFGVYRKMQFIYFQF
jgi:D-alanyl-lipoteichoic acid acyltransferase DltB (MBOAT superfamily)